MNEEKARRTAWRILGEVEEMMSGPGVEILRQGQTDGRQEKAFFQDAEYHELEDAITNILRSSASETPVAAARIPPAR